MLSINNSKECSRCKQFKNLSDFRTRIDKPKRDGSRNTYLNNTCRQCDKEIAKEYYDSKKEDAIFKDKNKIRVKIYAQSNKNKIRQ